MPSGVTRRSRFAAMATRCSKRQTPERALEIAREHSEMIDLILTDVITPGLSGPAFVHRLRESRVATPAIYMSGYPGEMIASAAVTSGDMHLSKPFATEELLLLCAPGDRRGQPYCPLARTPGGIAHIRALTPARR